METIIKNGCMKIMQVFYKDKHKSFHLRELARRTNMNENSTTRFLKMLEEAEILEYSREGNLKKYSIKKTKKLFSVFAMFDLEEFEKLPSIRKRAIDAFYRELAEKPIFMILFGSVAKGNFKDDSDIDLVGVFNRRVNITESEEYAEAQTGVKIKCLTLDYKSFISEIKTKEDKVIASAISSGYPLLNHISYYEEVLK